MNIILLSGGSGKHLWPLSNDIRSKQFIRIFRKPEHHVSPGTEYTGSYESMVQRIYRQIMFAEKSWGSYRVLDVEKGSMTVKVTLNPGRKMTCHSHKKRDEIWNVIRGTGKAIIDGTEQPVKAGDVITMSAGCRHTVIADTELQLIEVQLGSDISVADKKKHAML